MRLANLRIDGSERPAVLDPGRGWVLLEGLEVDCPRSIPELIATGLDHRVREPLARAAAAASDGDVIPSGGAAFAAPFRNPRLLWGIGLNYREHARDLDAPHPSEPASFMKGDHTIIGPGEDILLPAESRRVTSEAELGIIIGRTAWQVEPADALGHIAAVLCILDQTAEDILQRDPRFLTRAKNYPTFLSLGAEVITTDEVLEPVAGLNHLRVATWHNGSLYRENIVGDMTFDPAALVAFHSRVFPLQPGDVVLTGTPGSVVVEDGDIAECRIGGVGTLVNPVRRLRG